MNYIFLKLIKNEQGLWGIVDQDGREVFGVRNFENCDSDYDSTLTVVIDRTVYPNEEQ